MGGSQEGHMMHDAVSLTHSIIVGHRKTLTRTLNDGYAKIDTGIFPFFSLSFFIPLSLP